MHNLKLSNRSYPGIRLHIYSCATTVVPITGYCVNCVADFNAVGTFSPVVARHLYRQQYILNCEPLLWLVLVVDGSHTIEKGGGRGGKKKRLPKENPKS